MRPLVGVDDGENLCDALAYVVDASELGVGTSSNLCGPERNQLAAHCQPFLSFSSTLNMYDARLEVGELSREVILGLAPELGGLLHRL